MAKTKEGRKFKALEKDAIDAPTKDVSWEGQEVSAEADTKIQDDLGTGQEVILRFFDFGANVATFKEHKPTAQELFDGHKGGLEALLWKDGLKPYDAVEPRLMFSKDKKNYRFIIACIPRDGVVLADKPQTLSQLLNPKQ